MDFLHNAPARRIGAMAGAVVGGYLLYLAANPDSSAGTAFFSFLVGVALFVAVLAVLLAFYRQGRDEASADEVGESEWKVARFLSRAKDAAPLYLGIRLFLGYEWIDSARGKLESSAWMDTGEALRGYWERAVQIPEQGRPPITYPAYRSFIEYMLDHEWYTWFAKLIAVGELLIGIGLLIGGLTAIAAVFGLLMNFNFIYAGSASTNPTLIILGAVIIYGWRVAGWWGVDGLVFSRFGVGRRAQRPAIASGGSDPPSRS